MKDNSEALVASMTTQEKASLTSGGDFWNTKSLRRLGVQQSCSPTARTGYASRREQAIISASTTASRRRASHLRWRWERPSIPLRIEDTPAFGNFPGSLGHVRYGEAIFVGYRWYDHRKLDVAFPFGPGASSWRATTTCSVSGPPAVTSGAKPWCRSRATTCRCRCP